MRVLSLFDGCSCTMQALKNIGIIPDIYYASEIDKYAIQVSKRNHPEIIQLGDINNWRNWDIDWESITHLVGGSPCQGFSFAGKQLNFKDERSKLFFVYVDILNHIRQFNPDVVFLLENVKMKKEYQDVISGYLGVQPIEINSSLVSAQSRKRLYWTNIEGVQQPEDRGILLADIVLDDVFPVALHNIYGGFGEAKVRVFKEKSPTIRTGVGGGHIPHFVKRDLVLSKKAIEYMNKAVNYGRNPSGFCHNSDIRNDKSATVVANFFKGVPYNVFKDWDCIWDCIRKFHPVEVERLQTLPDNYTEGVSNTQRYKILGNGFTCAVIEHIIRSSLC